MKKIVLLIFTVFALFKQGKSECSIPTYLNFTYSFTELTIGSTVEVPWNSDCPSALMKIQLIRYTPAPAQVVQTYINIPNSGNFMFSISSAHLLGTYGFYIQDIGSNIWTYGPIFDLDAPLPVDLVDFNGKLINNMVQLKWSTASEVNNLGFEIERSNNGKGWELIVFLKGIGSSTLLNEYKYQDSNPILGINYYRIKLIDNDGAFEYSKVISITVRKENEIEIYPNPTNGRLEIIGVKMTNIKIVDNLGRVVKEQTMSDQIVDISELPSGLYFISVMTNKGMVTKRIIRE